MYLKIKKIELQEAKYGDNIVITMIGLYDEKDKWIRWVKLNDELIEKLTEVKIQL